MTDEIVPEPGPIGHRSLLESALAEAIARHECPICASTAGDAAHAMHYFTVEGHSEPEVLEEYRHGPYCTTHGQYALKRTDMGSALAAAQSYALRAGLRYTPPLNETDRRFGAGADPACPACRSLRGSAARSAFFLAKPIRATPALARASGLVCQSHLPLLAPLLPDDIFHDVVAALAARLGDADLPQETVLHLTAGMKPPVPAWPMPGQTPTHPSGDPAEDLLDDMRERRCCLACMAMARIMTSWTEWLVLHTEQKDIGDLLPTCRDHLWALGLTAPPALTGKAVEHSRQTQVRRLALALDKMPPRDNATRFQAAWRRVLGIGPTGLAREWLARPLRCPFCDRLEIAESETLQLLAALLRLQPNRKRFADAFGLCLRHAARFARLCTDPEINGFVAAVQNGKFALLLWQLDVCGRKNAWQWRPDPKGPEMAAPWQAVLRLSGGC
jgi:hypothetical protein